MVPRICLAGSNRSRFVRVLVLASAPFLAGSPHLAAQQPSYGYGYGSQNQPYAAPQYGQPQYGQQPQYPTSPQYPAPPYGQQPQYNQQPQYGEQPSYGQPSPYAQPPQDGAGQPYGDQQPYAAPGEPYDGQPEAIQPDTGDGAQPTQPPLGPDQLEQLVAPIALYPDSLLAEILTASTYPAQVAVADQWLRQMQAQGYGSPDQVAAGADSQNWDPSVKALTAFPQVLDMLNRNLQWTTQLGDAYFNQPQDVMQTVQVLRQRAQQAGNLQNSPQESVSDDQGPIELAPPSPQYVYVPYYNPWAVYGAPIAPYPGFSFLDALGSFFGAGLRFGPGIAMAAFDRTPFGLIAWGLDWLGHAIFFNHSTYFTHSATVADWGLPHGGARAYGGWARGGRWNAGYGRDARGNYAGNRAYGRENDYARGGRGFAEAGRESAYGRGGQYGGNYGSPRLNYGRPAQQAYNRPTPAFSRPQAYGGESYGRNSYGGRSFYGSGVYGRGQFGYAARPGESYSGRSYASPSRSYRSPQSTYQRSYVEQPRGFAQSNRSGGFFGRGGESYRGGREPKAFSGGRSFFGGHSSGGFKAPRGGGRSGGHFGGGHGGGGGHRHR